MNQNRFPRRQELTFYHTSSSDSKSSLTYWISKSIHTITPGWFLPLRLLSGIFWRSEFQPDLNTLRSRVWSGIFLMTKQESLQAIQKDLQWDFGSCLALIFARNVPKGKLNGFSQNDMQATQLSPISWAWHNQIELFEYIWIKYKI